GLSQQLVHKRRLAVINVRNDGDITDFIHRRVAFRGEKRGEYRRDRRGVKPPQIEWSSVRKLFPNRSPAVQHRPICHARGSNPSTAPSASTSGMLNLTAVLPTNLPDPFN